MTGGTVALLARTGSGLRRAPAGRLRASRDVRAVFASRRMAISPLAVVHVREQELPGPPRVTVVAGRKVGGAVDRNRVKRRLRAVLADAVLRDGLDYVVVGRQATRTAPFSQLRERLAAQLDEAAAQ